jgi:hypothetical protein
MGWSTLIRILSIPFLNVERMLLFGRFLHINTNLRPHLSLQERKMLTSSTSYNVSIVRAHICTGYRKYSHGAKIETCII